MKLHYDHKVFNLCAYCPDLCLSACPVSTVSGDLTLSPWGKMNSVWKLETGLIKTTQETILPTYYCLDCLACFQLCEHSVDVPLSLAGARNRTEQKPLYTKLNWSTEVAWRKLRQVAPAWRISDHVAVLLHTGPEFFENELTMQILASIFNFLDKIDDKSVGINRDSVLECGHLAWSGGEYDKARARAKRLWKRIGKYNLVLVASPHCASFMLRNWPEAGLERSNLQTLLSFAADKIHSRPVPLLECQIAFHDPCHLGRHLNQYKEPRTILGKITGGKLIEPMFCKEKSACCGGGGELPFIAPELSQKIAKTFIQSVSRENLDYIVTACPKCRSTLENAGHKTKDIFELLDEVL